MLNVSFFSVQGTSNKLFSKRTFEQLNAGSTYTPTRCCHNVLSRCEFIKEHSWPKIDFVIDLLASQTGRTGTLNRGIETETVAF